MVGLGVGLTAVFTMLSPLAAGVSEGLFVAVRILEGLCEVGGGILEVGGEGGKWGIWKVEEISCKK